MSAATGKDNGPGTAGGLTGSGLARLAFAATTVLVVAGLGGYFLFSNRSATETGVSAFGGDSTEDPESPDLVDAQTGSSASETTQALSTTAVDGNEPSDRPSSSEAPEDSVDETSSSQTTTPTEVTTLTTAQDSPSTSADDSPPDTRTEALGYEEQWLGRPEGDLLLALFDYGCPFNTSDEDPNIRRDIQFDVSSDTTYYRTPQTAADSVSTQELIADLPELLEGKNCLKSYTSGKDGPHMVLELEGGPPTIEGTSREQVRLATNPWPDSRKGEVLDLVSTGCDLYVSNPSAARPWVTETVTIQFWLADLDSSQPTMTVIDTRAVVPQPDGSLRTTSLTVSDEDINNYVNQVLQTPCLLADVSTRHDLINLYLIADFDSYQLPVP